MATTDVREEATTATNGTPTPADAQLAYQTAIALYTYEGSQVWARFNAMLVVHGILVAAVVLLLTILPSSTTPTTLRVIVILLASIGGLVSLAWLSLTARGFGYHDAFLSAAQQIEAEHFILRIFPFQPTLSRRMRQVGRIPIRQSAYLIIGLFVFLYASVLVIGLSM